MKKRIAAGLLAGGLVAGSVFGLAASLDVTAKGLGAGTGTVTSCDTNGVSVNYVFDGSNVTDVAISGIAATCENAKMDITVTDGGAGATATVASVGAGGSETAALSVPVAAADITSVGVILVGP